VLNLENKFFNFFCFKRRKDSEWAAALGLGLLRDKKKGRRGRGRLAKLVTKKQGILNGEVSLYQ